jgi:hypothetical protein
MIFSFHITLKKVLLLVTVVILDRGRYWWMWPPKDHASKVRFNMVKLLRFLISFLPSLIKFNICNLFSIYWYIVSWIWFIVFDATIFQLYCGDQLYWWRRPEYPVETTDNLYHIMLYRVHLAMNGVRTHNFGCVVGYLRKTPLRVTCEWPYKVNL